MLRIENLVKKYKDVTAVDNISFTAEKGEIFGLLGPNGAGKTTTIRTILNILKPDSGTISYNNAGITENYKNLVGYLPEDRGLYRKSKTTDVIKYFCRLKNIRSNEAAVKTEEWMRRLNIDDLKNKKIEALSKGNQQKIQFITAVIHNPEIIVLDEPFSGFDPINQELIAGEIINFRDQGKIIIISTHQMETAERLCSKLLLLNRGKEVYCGKLDELKRRYKRDVIKIKFSGDPVILYDFSYLQNIKLSGSTAEFELSGDISPSEFLRVISQKMDITALDSAEPSLHSIFIDLISRGINE